MPARLVVRMVVPTLFPPGYRLDPGETVYLLAPSGRWEPRAAAERGAVVSGPMWVTPEMPQLTSTWAYAVTSAVSSALDGSLVLLLVRPGPPVLLGALMFPRGRPRAGAAFQDGLLEGSQSELSSSWERLLTCALVHRG